MTDSFGRHGDLLGRPTTYSASYNPGLLQPIARRHARAQLGLRASALPFRGVDLWTAYEVSWLNLRGKPQVATAEFEVTADSGAIIESKSLKLYLNAFSQARFADAAALQTTLATDLSAASQGQVSVTLRGLNEVSGHSIGGFEGECLDDLDIEVDCYLPDAGLLALEDSGLVVAESLYSDLLRSNCPVTGQPDWASVLIRYRGPAIARAALLRYIVSFREHQDFHEHCVERMFLDIKQQCRPAGLTVYARYTRRGGLDINPFRSDMEDRPAPIRLLRQ